MEDDMDHQHYQEWLQLSLYDELSDDARALLEDHLRTCTECQAEGDRLRGFHRILSAHRPMPVTEQLLQQARRERRVAWHESVENGLGKRVGDALMGFFARPLRMALAGVAILVVGFAAGWFAMTQSVGSGGGFIPGMHQAGGNSESFAPGSMRVQNIRFIERDANTGNIEVEFEAVSPMRVRGNVNDASIQYVLARVLLNEENPGMRLRAANMFGTASDDRTSADYQVKTALIAAMKADPNLGVRKQALTVLQEYLPDPSVTEAFLSVLANEKNIGMKIAAINALDLKKLTGRTASQDVLQALQKTVASDENNYIRIRAQAALEEVQQ